MSEVQKIRNPSRKFFFNLFFFIFSIIIIVAIWPVEKNDTWPEHIGSVIVVSSCLLVLYLFLSHFRPEILEVNRKTFFIILTITSFVLLTRLMIISNAQNIIYIIPFAIVPIIIHTFYDARLALFILLITLMLAGFIIPDPFEYVFMNFISGVVAIFSLTNIYRRGKLFFSSLMVVLSYSVIYLAISIMHADSFVNINWINFKWITINGILVLLSYPLILLFERKFFFLSDTTLLELSDTNQPLLRILAEKAPGSFQHSRQVANLAEEAARVIGANLLMVRTGALYHDIGKIINSEYFIENQASLNSPHQDLDPVESSKLIINHVNEGVSIARKHKLPVQIIDFIRTHHGTSRSYFFYKKYHDQDQELNRLEKDFAYPGPKPFSKEMALVMMADAVEASSRTLEKYNETNISELVERIIDYQEQDDQFSDSPLTFKNIADIKNILKKSILNIYHPRIIYPPMKI